MFIVNPIVCGGLCFVMNYIMSFLVEFERAGCFILYLCTCCYAADLDLCLFLTLPKAGMWLLCHSWPPRLYKFSSCISAEHEMYPAHKC